MGAPHILLLTGSPGVGKTTVIQRVAERLKDRQLAGFYTEEIRAHDARQGFRLTTFDGRETIMAHVDLPKRFRVGRYGVDVDAIDSIIEGALRLDEQVEFYLVDEIGKMECLSSRFIAAVRRLLDSGKPVIATVAQKGSGFIDTIKRRPDAELWQVLPANRGELPESVVGWLQRCSL